MKMAWTRVTRTDVGRRDPEARYIWKVMGFVHKCEVGEKSRIGLRFSEWANGRSDLSLIVMANMEGIAGFIIFQLKEIRNSVMSNGDVN